MSDDEVISARTIVSKISMQRIKIDGEIDLMRRQLIHDIHAIGGADRVILEFMIERPDTFEWTFNSYPPEIGLKLDEKLRIHRDKARELGYVGVCNAGSA